MLGKPILIYCVATCIICNVQYSVPNSTLDSLRHLFPCGSRIWSRGPQKFFQDFADVVKWSWVSKVSQYWSGTLGPGSSCTFNCQICILPLFLLLFLQIFKCTFVCGYIRSTKYLFQYERFWLFWHIQFSVSLSEKMGLNCSFGLVCRYISL